MSTLVESGQARHRFENRGMDSFGGRETVRGYLEAIKAALQNIADVTIEESKVLSGGLEFGAKLKK